MKRIIIVILCGILMLCCGCKSKKQVLDKPEGLIPRSTMVEIIAECYMIEGTIETAPEGQNRADLTRSYYKDLFKRYNITKEQFVNSVNYYVSEESSAKKLLSDASDLVMKKRKELDVPYEVPNMPQDTLEQSAEQ